MENDLLAEIESVKNEIAIHQRLKHPNIIRLHQFFSAS